jgi:hypothetical protein
MSSVPVEEHIHFAKIDLADSYWRMIVELAECWNFAYVMPFLLGDPVQLVIPSALQMGWNKSPAYFCTTTKAALDVAQAWIDDDVPLPVDPMEPLTTPTVPAHKQMSQGPLHQMKAVYGDDFLVTCVEDPLGTFLQTMARATLHAIRSTSAVYFRHPRPYFGEEDA